MVFHILVLIYKIINIFSIKHQYSMIFRKIRSRNSAVLSLS